MTTYILAGVIVILLIALAIITFAWRIAVYDANQADDFILYLDSRKTLDSYTLPHDAMSELRDEAENIRQWRGEVQGND